MRLTNMFLTALIPLVAAAAPLFAQTQAEEELLPGFSHDQAVTCLALWVVNLESEGPGLDPAGFAQEMVFFSRLIALKATPDQAAGFDARFAQEIQLIQSWEAALDNPATRDDADMELTGTAKMCWFQALAAEGGPYEGQ